MRDPWFKLKSLLMFVLLICLIGCGSSHTVTETTPPTSTTDVPIPSTDPQLESSIKDATSASVNLAFVAFGKQSPDTVKTAANDTINIINTSILPALNGSQSLTANTVNTLVETNLLTKVDPLIQGGIGLGAAFLDAVLPEPTADTYLTEVQLTYLRTFFTAIVDGSQKYLAGIPADSAVAKKLTRGVGKWFYCPPPKK